MFHQRNVVIGVSVAVLVAVLLFFRGGDELGDLDSVEVRSLADDWHVSKDEIVEARRLAQRSGLKYSKQILFLFAKGIGNVAVYHPNNGKPVTRFDLIMSPPDEHWQTRRERLNRLLESTGDRTADEVPSDVMGFDAALASIGKEWSFIFHRDKGIDVVQRWQRSGLCYMHAPEVLQYYLVAVANRTAGIIDMAKMIRQTFDAKQLVRHIFDDEGGSSRLMLENMLIPKSIIVTENPAHASDRLREFGPLLISGFKVHKDFDEGDLLSFDGQPTGAVIGHHSMVIIGHRTDATGRDWFLVQNWWPKKQFVEMSAAYLKACWTGIFLGISV